MRCRKDHKYLEIPSYPSFGCLVSCAMYLGYAHMIGKRHVTHARLRSLNQALQLSSADLVPIKIATGDPELVPNRPSRATLSKSSHPTLNPLPIPIFLQPHSLEASSA
jgi:hypothetical protein